MRIPILLFVLMTLMYARENPFLPGPPPQTPAAITAPETETALPEPEETQPIPGPDESSDEPVAEIVDFKMIRFDLTEKEVRIQTKDKLKKHFAVKNPTRIILNFVSSKGFQTQRKSVSTAPFREIRVGFHEGYYSVVIEVDGSAGYRIVPTENGYTLTLR